MTRTNRSSRRRLNLSELDKDFIELSVRQQTMSVTELACHFHCHPRSIHRVLEERGVITVSTKTSAAAQEARKVLEILKKYSVPASALEGILAARQSIYNHQSPNARQQQTAALFQPAVAA